MYAPNERCILYSFSSIVNCVSSTVVGITAVLTTVESTVVSITAVDGE